MQLDFIRKLTELNVVELLMVSVLVTSLVGFWCRSRSTMLFALIPGEALSWRGFHRNLTHGFLHSNLPHLLFNLSSLYLCGKPLLRLTGSTNNFLFIFMSSLIGGGLLYSLIFSSRRVAVIGLSGAIFGVVFAALFLNTNIVFSLFFLKIPTHFFVPLFVVICFFFEIFKVGNIAHGLHLTGAVTGVLAAYVVHPNEVIKTSETILSALIKTVVPFSTRIIENI